MQETSMIDIKQLLINLGEVFFLWLPCVRKMVEGINLLTKEIYS